MSSYFDTPVSISTPPEIPKELQFTKQEGKLFDEIQEYRELEQRNLGYTMKQREPEIEELQGQNGKLNIPMAEARIDKLEKQAQEAAKMIAQRKAEGYQGKKKSYSEYKTLMRELKYADEFEKGDILAANAVGKDGIQYWQRQKKNAERIIEKLRFAIKLQRRYEAGIE